MIPRSWLQSPLLQPPGLQRLTALAFAGYALLIGWLSLMPTTGTGRLWDKAVHFTIYLIFVLLGSPLCRRWSRLLLLALGVLVYSAALEIAQHFVGREMSLRDLLANGLGIALALLILRWRWNAPRPPFLR